MQWYVYEEWFDLVFAASSRADRLLRAKYVGSWLVGWLVSLALSSRERCVVCCGSVMVYLLQEPLRVGVPCRYVLEGVVDLNACDPGPATFLFDR